MNIDWLSLIDVMTGFGFLGVLIYGGAEIMSGEKSLGEFMAFFTAISLAFEPLRRLGNLSGLWQADAIYTISAAIPAGLRTIDAEVTVENCKSNGIPTV